MVCSVLAFASAVPVPAWAQDAAPPGDASAPAAPADADEEEAGFEEPKPAPPPAEAEAEAEAAPADADKAPEATAPAAATDDPARAEAVSAVGVELLPGSAYPEPMVRGIRGGSLRTTFHGLQWPQLPYLAGQPKTRLGLSGSAWVDTSRRSTEAGNPNGVEYDRIRWLQQSRFVLRATPTYSMESGFFVQGQGELVANSDVPNANQLVDTDDLWVRVGKWNVFDIQFGRFQGWEVYHLGMGLDLNTLERQGAVGAGDPPPGLYGVTYFWDRPSGAGNIAAHVYPTDFLRFELLGQVGQPGQRILFAARPVGILDLGFVKLKVGAEYGKETPPEQADDVCDPTTGVCRDPFPQFTERRGFGAGLQFVLDPYVEAGFSYAAALIDEQTVQDVPDLGKTNDTKTYGGFLNVAVFGPHTIGEPGQLVLGAGYHKTKLTTELVNPTTGEHDNFDHTQYFGAIQYTLWRHLAVKLVVSHATGGYHPLSNNMPIEYENKALSYRLRVAYDF
jgi:hypothetical protein